MTKLHEIAQRMMRRIPPAARKAPKAAKSWRTLKLGQQLELQEGQSVYYQMNSVKSGQRFVVQEVSSLGVKLQPCYPDGTPTSAFGALDWSDKLWELAFKKVKKVKGKK
jgi:hypothetical protein